MNINNFIAKGNALFNNNFDYSKMIPDGFNKKVKLICKKHKEEIMVTPKSHLQQKNGGCNKCRKDNADIPIKLSDGEIMKDVNIEKYKKFYGVTNFGNCFSKRTGKKLIKGKVTGYYTVMLYDNFHNPKQTFNIHYLVYITFATDYDPTKVIDHIDGNKFNNNITNLRCVSQSENVKNTYKNNKSMYRPRSILMYDKNDVMVKEFDSTTQVRDYLGYKKTSSILLSLQNEKLLCKGYKLKYKNHIISETVDNLIGYKCIGKINDNDYSNYYVNKKGDVVNSKTMKKMKNSIDVTGYKIVALYYTTKNQKHFKVHRLIAKYFLADGEKYFYDNNYVVNHIDENKLNNDLSNLEWVTYQVNTIKSVGKSVAKIDPKTDKIIKIYDSISNACSDMGQKYTPIISRVCKGAKWRKTVYGFKWKYVD